MGARRLDPWAVTAAVVTVGTGGVYLALIDRQEGEVALWYLAVLVAGAVAAGYGAVRSASHRRAALVGGAVLLAAAGLLGILTIGLPILAAAALCAIAAVRAAPAAVPRS